MAIPNELLTRTEQYLNRTATGSGTIPDEPLTRVEMYLNKIATGDGDVPDVPLTRVEQYLAEIAENGGGSSITVEPLTVTQNGTTTAPSGKAYSPVTVNVPQPSGTKNIGQNGEYDVSSYASANVNVQPRPAYVNDAIHESGTATLANPFDGLDYGRLMDGLASSTAKWNAFISFQFQGMNVMYHPFVANNAINAMAFLPNDGQGNPIGAYASWDRYGELGSLYLLSGGQMQDLSSIAANIPVMTIIYGTTDPPRAD